MKALRFDNYPLRSILLFAGFILLFFVHFIQMFYLALQGNFQKATL